MKGILLAGGSGKRLYPLTKAVCKQLLPVYNKPVIYYPLSLLMLAGIREILVISTPSDLPLIENLLGDGREVGISLTYKVQPKPNGIAEAFLIGEDFIKNDSVCLVLGDNLIFGHALGDLLVKSARPQQGARVFAHHVPDPERFGVVELDKNEKAISLEEKPNRPRSNWAVTGLYFYDRDVVEITKNLAPSARGELEITDVNKAYLKAGNLAVTTFGRGVAWFDLGTYDSLLSASLFVQTLERQQGLKIACIEEIALLRGFIDATQVEKLAHAFGESPYGSYMTQVLRERESTSNTSPAGNKN